MAWARFDFRGVGASEGAYDDGRGEVDDALAVIDAAARRSRPGVPVAVCGHSFGSWVGLRAAAADGGVDRVLLVAPSARFFDASGTTVRASPGRRRSSSATRTSSATSTRRAPSRRRLGAELRVFEGFDHHFMKSRRAMAEAALPIIAPEVADP